MELLINIGLPKVADRVIKAAFPGLDFLAVCSCHFIPVVCFACKLQVGCSLLWTALSALFTLLFASAHFSQCTTWLGGWHVCWMCVASVPLQTPSRGPSTYLPRKSSRITRQTICCCVRRPFQLADTDSDTDTDDPADRWPTVGFSLSVLPHSISIIIITILRRESSSSSESHQVPRWVFVPVVIA